MENKYILLRDFIKNDFAVSTDLGDKLFVEIKQNLDEGRIVEVDFKGVIVVITAFLNAAIGGLYNNLYSDDFLKHHLIFKNLTESNKQYLNLVIDNAKKYFRNEDGFNKNLDDLLNGKD